MRSLSTVSLADVLPANLVADPFVAAMIAPFDEEFHRLVADTAAIKLFSALQIQPDAVLDELAWQFNVDFYDQGLPIDAKRNLIAQSIYWHSIKGTPHVIERVVEIAFGEGIVEEWFDYGGDPFRFRVISTGGKFPTGDRFDVLQRMIKLVKRASALLEAITIQQSGQQPLVIGCAMQIGQHITLGSA
jgi:phage tail P2-like protein